MKKLNLSLFAATAIFSLVPIAGAQDLFPQVESESVNAIAGNWKVELRNKEGEIFHDAFITMRPPVESFHEALPSGGHVERFRVAEDKEWRGVSDMEVSGRTVKFRHNYGVGGYWGANSDLRFEGDTATGQWNYKGRESGSERWTRLRPKLNRVEFGPVRSHEFGSVHSAPVSVVPYGRTAHVKGVYNERWWGKGNTFPHARPKFYIRVFGENLGGYHLTDVVGQTDFRVLNGWSYEESEQEGYRVAKSGAVYASGPDGDRRVGQTYVVALWSEVSNGLKTLRLDDLEIPFIFDIEGLPEPGPDLRFVDTKGAELDEVMEGQIFALQAQFDEGETPRPSYRAAVKQGETEIAIPVREVDAAARVYRSGYYRIMQPRLVGEEESWSDWRATGDDIEIPDETARMLARHFGGVWQVHQRDADGGAAMMGEAWVTDAGGRAELRLGRGDGQRRFEMYDADVGLSPDGKAPAYWVAYFAEYETYPEHSLHPAVENLWLPRKGGEVVFALEKAAEILPVDYLHESRDPVLLEVSFPQPLKEWLAGDWSVDAALTPLGRGGNTIWTRKPPVIDEIVVLRDQRPGAFSSEYPADFSDTGNSRTLRRLLVVGENLPIGPQMLDHVGTSPESDDPLVEYTRVATDGTKPERDLKKAYDDRKRPRPPAGKDYMVVNADLDFGVSAGQKRLSLAGAQGDWTLQFSDTAATLRLTRTFASGSKASLDSVLLDDTAYLAIAFEHDRHLPNKKEIELALFVGKKKPVLLGRIMAKRAEDEIKPEFRTGALHFNYRQTKPDPNAAMNVIVKEGMELTAVPVDRGIAVSPVSFVVDESDYMVGEYWLDALKDVKIAGGKGNIDKPKQFAMERAEGYNKSLYVARVFAWDGSNRKVELRNGDHAAAILIRDEFVRQMSGLLPRYDRQTDRPVQIQKFIRQAQSNLAAARKDPFWKYNSKRSGSFPGGLPLWELLDIDDLMRRFGWTDRKATELWVYESVQDALKERVRNMRDAKEQATKTSSYRLEELMIFAGYRAPAVINAITARLVVKVDGRWVPDAQAIRFVEGLYVAGAAMRALEAYSDIDNSYNMLALAVVTGGAAGALELGGLATAATYTSFIANTADAIVSGGFGLYEYLKGESSYDRARGMSPLYGDEVVRDAAAGRQSGLMTAMGVLFPGQAATRELLGMPGLKAIARGRELAGEVTSGTGKLTDLDDVAKADLFDYYKSLRDRRFRTAAGGKVHPPLTPEDLKHYRELRKVLHPKPTRSPAAMTAAERQSLEALQADEALDVRVADRRAVGRSRGPDESGYFDPYGTAELDPLPSRQPEPETIPKTEAFTPEERAAIEAHQPTKVDEPIDPNKTQPIPFDPNKTQPVPFDPNKTQPVPFDPDASLPRMNDPTGAFGMSPVDPNAPAIRAEPKPVVRLERERMAAEEGVSQPFQGREAMDAKHQANADYYRQKQADNAQEDIRHYDLENWQTRGTPEYDAGLAELNSKLEARSQSADGFREQRRAALEKDHTVLDMVEKHTGYRSAGDYSALELERLRPGREFTDQQAVAGVMANRFKSNSGPLQGTPKQHLSTLEEAGLSRAQAKTYLMEWYNPAANPSYVEGIGKFVDRYLDWAGLK